MIGVLRDITDSKLIEIQRVVKEDMSEIFNKERGLSVTMDQVLKLIADFGNYKTAELWLVSEKNENNLGGKIWVESKKDEGSTFHFTIPK